MKKLKIGPVRIGLAGLGNVGRGVYEILRKDAEILQKRSGVQFEIVAVSARSKKDFVDPKIKFYSNPIDLANDSEIDVVVEVMGGIDVAKNLIEASLKNRKNVVTANKALLAQYGFEISQIAEQNNLSVGFEAAVAGAIPIIKIFKEGLVANEIEEFYAILNGTCNFILTKMQRENLYFSIALKQAQELGYAEVDPTFDIDGTDTAHKLTILSSIASGSKPAFSQISIEGIDKIGIDDIKLALGLGYKIKLLAVYKKTPKGVQQAVYPAIIPLTEKIANVDDSFNAILTKASNANWNFSVGRGAGSLPTASAIVADLVDISFNQTSNMFGVKNNDLVEASISSISDRVGGYFLSLVVDKNLAQNGDLAKTIFGEKIVVVQANFIDAGEEILCGFLTGEQREGDIIAALKMVDQRLVKAIKFLRVESAF